MELYCPSLIWSAMPTQKMTWIIIVPRSNNLCFEEVKHLHWTHTQTIKETFFLPRHGKLKKWHGFKPKRLLPRKLRVMQNTNQFDVLSKHFEKHPWWLQQCFFYYDNLHAFELTCYGAKFVNACNYLSWGPEAPPFLKDFKRPRLRVN